MRRHGISNGGVDPQIARAQIIISETVQNLSAAQDLLARVSVSPHVPGPSSKGVGHDIFSGEEFPAQEAIGILDYARQNYSDTLHFPDSSDLGILLYLSLDAIIQRLFTFLRNYALESGMRVLDEDLTLLQFSLYLRNKNASRVWTLEDAPEGAQIVSTEFDDVGGKRNGRVVESLMPRIPEVRQLRGVVQL